jgi:hypothetical protein
MNEDGRGIGAGDFCGVVVEFIGIPVVTFAAPGCVVKKSALDHQYYKIQQRG